MGFLVLSVASDGAGLVHGKTWISDERLAWSWADELAHVVMAAGHQVVALRDYGAGRCRWKAREIARDADGPVVHLVAAVGRPRVVYAKGSANGYRAAEEVAKALGEAPAMVEDLGITIKDYRHLGSIGDGPRRPGNMSDLLVSPVGLEVMAEGAEAELGQVIGAAILELLGKPKKAKAKKAAKM